MPKSVFYKVTEKKKIALLKPAIKEFVTKPYEKITVSSLTETMDILRTDFYYYFQDKDDVLNYLLDELKESVSRYIDNPTIDDVFKYLFETFCKNDGAKYRLYLIELTENYHPLFVVEFSKLLRKMFMPNVNDEELGYRIISKVQKFLTIIYLYKHSSISLEVAYKLLNE